MGLADKLIERLEYQSATLKDFRQLDDQRRARICVLEDALLAAKAERDKALADVQHWRQARQDATTPSELMQAEIASLRQQLAEAQQQDVDAMRAEIELLRAFFERVRCEAHEDPELYGPFARLVLQFNAGSIEPAPCQGCERLRAELADEEECRQLQVAEIERLDAFVENVRSVMDSITGVTSKLCGISEALAELDGQPAPVAETAEGGK